VLRRTSEGVPLYFRAGCSGLTTSPASACLGLTALVGPLFKRNPLRPLARCMLTSMPCRKLSTKLMDPVGASSLPYYPP
jgi:hypothetical protein